MRVDVKLPEIRCSAETHPSNRDWFFFSSFFRLAIVFSTLFRYNRPGIGWGYQNDPIQEASWHCSMARRLASFYLRYNLLTPSIAWRALPRLSSNHYQILSYGADAPCRLPAFCWAGPQVPRHIVCTVIRRLFRNNRGVSDNSWLGVRCQPKLGCCREGVDTCGAMSQLHRIIQQRWTAANYDQNERRSGMESTCIGARRTKWCC